MAGKTEGKKTINKGESFACETCGLTVTIDENHAYKEDTSLFCCGAPMKPKAKKAAASKK